MERKERRKTIVTCEDMDCCFKHKASGDSKVKNECCILNTDAESFFNKFGITTCEFGCGETTIPNANPKLNELIKRRLKNRGILKG